MREDYASDNQKDEIDNPKIKLPKIEFGADEESIEHSIAEAVEQVPLDDQEPYWRIMDNKNIDIQEKLTLINDLLKQRNGDNQE